MRNFDRSSGYLSQKQESSVCKSLGFPNEINILLTLTFTCVARRQGFKKDSSLKYGGLNDCLAHAFYRVTASFSNQPN